MTSFSFRLRQLFVLAACVVAVAASASAQAPQAASILGTTTSQGGSVLLPGAHLSLLDAVTGEIVREADSDDRGSFRFVGLRPGSYRVRASLDQFQDLESPPVPLRAGQQARVDLDLPLAPRVETLVVSPDVDVPLTASAVPSRALKADDIRALQPVSPADVQNMLAIVPGAIRGPGGAVAINGGRPSQTRVQIDDVTIVDPATGTAEIDLPSEAVASMQVIPNPVGGEFGRLSAGVIQFHTRPAPNQPRYTFSDFIPEPRFRDGPHLYGIRDFSPRLFAGGPIVKNRLFFAESLQYEHYKPRVYGPDFGDETTTRNRLDSFTRVDASLSPRQFATISFGAFPKNVDNLFIGRFLPPSASPSERERPYLLTATERATIGNHAAVESIISLRDFSIDAYGGGIAPMVLSPSGRSGPFYDTQHRRMRTIQWKETLDVSMTGATGEHVFKFGTDLLAGAYDGTNVSQPVELRRLDGTLAQRINPDALSVQSASGADAGLFAADAWKPTRRVSIEPSARVDVDTVLGHTHVAPRIAAAVGVTSDGSAAVRGGIGRFYERVPLLVQSFSSFGTETITPFGQDGVTPLGPATTLSYAVAPRLDTPSATIWNVGYDHKLNADWLVSASMLQRAGSNELIVVPDPVTSQIVLYSAGRSDYRELSLWAQYHHKALHASASYVWSRSQGDTNSLESYFGTFRNPLVRPDEYAPTSLDVPHRVIAWWSAPVAAGFNLSGLVESRSGFAYSAVDANQNFVGPRNSLRFPHMTTLDVSVFREVSLGNHRVRLIGRAYHLLNTFHPTEVQNNIAAPDFGTLYSHMYRRFAIDIDILR